MQKKTKNDSRLKKRKFTVYQKIISIFSDFSISKLER